MSRIHVGNGFSIAEYKDERWPDQTVAIDMMHGNERAESSLTDAQVLRLYQWCQKHLLKAGLLEVVKQIEP